MIHECGWCATSARPRPSSTPSDTACSLCIIIRKAYTPNNEPSERELEKMTSPSDRGNLTAESSILSVGELFFFLLLSILLLFSLLLILSFYLFSLKESMAYLPFVGQLTMAPICKRWNHIFVFSKVKGFEVFFLFP
jgi:hypothetical protein